WVRGILAAALPIQAVLTHFTVRHPRHHLHVIRTLRDSSGSGRATRRRFGALRRGVYCCFRFNPATFDLTFLLVPSPPNAGSVRALGNGSKVAWVLGESPQNLE